MALVRCFFYGYFGLFHLFFFLKLLFCTTPLFGFYDGILFFSHLSSLSLLFSTAVGKDCTPDEKCSFRDILKLNLEEHLEAIETISDRATKEYSLKRALDRMEEEWEGQKFNCIVYKETGTSILSSPDEIQTILEDQLLKTQSMLLSPFLEYYEDRATKWFSILNTMKQLINHWVKVQVNWLYLEPLFASQDIKVSRYFA